MQYYNRDHYRGNCTVLRRVLLFIPRYASLYFCVCIEAEDNELLTLETIHRYVELLDKYFGNVSHAEPPLQSTGD